MLNTAPSNEHPRATPGLRSRRKLLQTASAGALAALLPRSTPAQRKKASPDLNVLFIGVDDLRPTLGCYGDPDIRTPNIDALAAQGLMFTRAYCQQAVCSPSRTSLLTGLRPDTTRVHDLQTHFRRYRPDATTLPEHFKDRGFTTAAFSKIFHKPQLDDYPSWSIPSWIPGDHEWKSTDSRESVQQRWNDLQANGWLSDERFYYEPSKRVPATEGQRGWGMPSWESRRVADNQLGRRPDGGRCGQCTRGTAPRALLCRGRFSSNRTCPSSHRKNTSTCIPSRGSTWPGSGNLRRALLPSPSTHSDEMRGYTDIPQEGPISDAKARDLIRAYRASVSYVDAQIGKVLDALDELRLREKTVVVLWGDHGYHLGDHGLWNKHTNFEAATRAPLIVRAPGRLSKGRKTQALTEFVDIYPSLCDLCGLDTPRGLEGSSFVPLFNDPNRLWKRAAFSQYPREIPGVGAGMGYSIRTRRFRYTEWRAEDSPYTSAELYDYQEDPLETRNLANLPPET